MNKNLKTTFIVFICLLMGGIIFTFAGCYRASYENKTYEITESFNNILIETTDSDVNLILTDNAVKVTTHEYPKVKYSVEVIDGTLVVKVNDSREWYDVLNTPLKQPVLNVYLTKENISELSIKTATGKVMLPDSFEFRTVSVENNTGDTSCYATVTGKASVTTDTGDITFKNNSVYDLTLKSDVGDISVSSVEIENKAELEMHTGSIKLTDVTCSALSAINRTGNTVIKNVTAEGDITASVSTGSLSVEGSAGVSASFKATTGNVKLSDSQFSRCITLECNTGDIIINSVNTVGITATTRTGDVKLTDVISGAGMNVTTNTGDIRLDRCDALDSIYLKANTGDIIGSFLSEKIFYAKANTGDVDVPHTTTGALCEITVNTGDIRISIVKQ